MLGCLWEGKHLRDPNSLGEQLGGVQVVWGDFIACGPRCNCPKPGSNVSCRGGGVVLSALTPRQVSGCKGDFYFIYLILPPPPAVLVIGWYLPAQEDFGPADTHIPSLAEGSTGVSTGSLCNEYLNFRKKFPLEAQFSLQELVYKCRIL